MTERVPESIGGEGPVRLTSKSYYVVLRRVTVGKADDRTDCLPARNLACDDGQEAAAQKTKKRRPDLTKRYEEKEDAVEAKEEEEEEGNQNL